MRVALGSPALLPYSFPMSTSDPRPFGSSAAARNRDPILAVLKRVLPPAGQVLEIASGTGEHAA
jgi:hypothetical protein